jgi:hypothetical protein
LIEIKQKVNIELFLDQNEQNAQRYRQTLQNYWHWQS